jgi:DNA-binding NarL/FixJ family response regulator
MELVRGKQRQHSREVYVPKRLRANHWLLESIGREAATQLSKEFPGIRLPLPSSLDKLERNNRIIQMRHQGETYKAIAEHMGMSVDTVKAVYYRWMKTSH